MMATCETCGERYWLDKVLERNVRYLKDIPVSILTAKSTTDSQTRKARTMRDELIEIVNMGAAEARDSPERLWDSCIEGIVDGIIDRLSNPDDAMVEAEWFYYGDDTSSENCRLSIDECITEDFEYENRPEGSHVLQVSGARPVPDMWIALRYFTEQEKDERQDDEDYVYTVHSSYDEATQAMLSTLKGNSDD